jgi:hypothetical protein
MKRFALAVVAVFVFGLVAGGSALFAQGTFKIPFKFEAGGKKLPAGEYSVTAKSEGQLVLKQASTGNEIPVPFTQRLDPPSPPIGEPRLVFDMVGNFEPSLPEYMTDYVMSEFWLPGQKGFLIYGLKGAHDSQIVKGEIAKK